MLWICGLQGPFVVNLRTGRPYPAGVPTAGRSGGLVTRWLFLYLGPGQLFTRMISCWYGATTVPETRQSRTRKGRVDAGSAPPPYGTFLSRLYWSADALRWSD
jgi:hypothetical protein